MEPKNSLDRAIEAAGSQRALAMILGVSQQAISARLKAGEALSRDDAVTVAAATGVSVLVLRPDFLPPTEPALQATG